MMEDIKANILLIITFIVFIITGALTLPDLDTQDLKHQISIKCYQQSKTIDEFDYCRNKMYYNQTGRKTLW